MTTASTKGPSFPRLYILSIYEKAVAEGACWITGLTETQYRSLKASFYRLRRRSDKASAAIIRPEFHLVTIGEYDAAKQRCAALYSMLPDGHALPQLSSMSDAERSTAVEQALPPAPELPVPIPPLLLPSGHVNDDLIPIVTPDDVDALLNAMTKRALASKSS